MAVDQHPSRKPSPPKKPPATSTTDGSPNTIQKTGTGGADMNYGSRNGRALDIKPSHKSERSHDFSPGSADGSARSPGKAQSQEGPSGKASKPGDE